MKNSKRNCSLLLVHYDENFNVRPISALLLNYCHKKQETQELFMKSRAYFNWQGTYPVILKKFPTSRVSYLSVESKHFSTTWKPSSVNCFKSTHPLRYACNQVSMEFVSYAYPLKTG